MAQNWQNETTSLYPGPDSELAESGQKVRDFPIRLFD